MPKKIMTALYIGQEQLKRLKKIAAARDVSFASLVREGINWVIKKYSKRTY